MGKKAREVNEQMLAHCLEANARRRRRAGGQDEQPGYRSGFGSSMHIMGEGIATAAGLQMYNTMHKCPLPDSGASFLALQLSQEMGVSHMCPVPEHHKCIVSPSRSHFAFNGS